MPWIRYNATSKLYEVAATEGGAYSTLEMDAAQLSQGKLTLSSGAHQLGAVRVTAAKDSTGWAGKGIEQELYSDGQGYIVAYDRTANAYIPLNIYGSYVDFGGVTSLCIGSKTNRRRITASSDGSAFQFLADNNGWAHIYANSFFERNRSIAIGEWASYTPSWTTNNGTPTIGNGALYGSYAIVGTTCFFAILLQCGTTTTYGVAGNYFMFGLPFPNATTWVIGGSGYTQGAAWWPLQPKIVQNNTVTPLVDVNIAGGLVYGGSSQPYNPWTGANTLFLQGRYQI